MNEKKSLSKARQYARTGQYVQAIEEYCTILQHHYENTQYLQEYAELLAEAGIRQKAVDILFRAVNILFKKGLLREVISIYKRILQLDPYQVTAYIKLLEIFKALGLSEDARIFSRGAVEKFRNAGAVEDLQKLLEKIIELDPEDVWSRMTLAEICLKMKQTAMALRHYEESLPILRRKRMDEMFITAANYIVYYYPERIELCKELAAVYLKRKETSKAETLLLFCYMQQPTDIETINLLMEFFNETGDREKAELLHSAKLKLKGDAKDVLEAQETCRKALESDYDEEITVEIIKRKIEKAIHHSEPLPEVAKQPVSPVSDAEIPAASRIKLPLKQKQAEPAADAHRPADPIREKADSFSDEVPALEELAEIRKTSSGIERVRLSKSDAMTHVDLGIAYIEMGAWNHALDAFMMAANDPKTKAMCYNLMGTCLELSGNIDAAIGKYKEGLAAKELTEEQTLSLCYDLAHAYMNTGDSPRAVELMEKIQKIAPKYKDIRTKMVALKRATAKSKRKKPPAAKAPAAPRKKPTRRRKIEKPVTVIPVTVISQKWMKAPGPRVTPLGLAKPTEYDIGHAFMEMGQVKEAIVEFAKAAKNPKKQALCFHMIGNCLVMEGNVKEAIKKYKIGLSSREKTREQEINLHYDLSEAYLMLEDYNRALWCLRKVKRMNPEFKKVVSRIAEVEGLQKESTASMR